MCVPSEPKVGNYISRVFTSVAEHEARAVLADHHRLVYAAHGEENLQHLVHRGDGMAAQAMLGHDLWAALAAVYSHHDFAHF